MNRFLFLTVLSSILLMGCSQQRSPIASQLQTAPEIRTEEQRVNLNKEAEPAHTLNFISDASTTLSAWREFVKKEFNQKLDKSKGNYVAENVMISQLSSGPISLYSNVEERNEGSQLQVWVMSGEEFVSHSNNPQIAQQIDAAMKDFAKGFYGKHYELAIANQQEDQKEVADELSSLEKQRKTISENLKDNKEEIDENKEEIDELQKEINELQEENENLTKANQELEKEQRENKKAIDEQQKLLNKKQQEVETLRTNSKNYQ